MLKTQRKGFTLIELLIVVAIIAILAAIAIPNFLAAQVRSRVASVKAGMRTTITGIESYYVDNNDYPLANRWTTAGSGIELGKFNFHIPNSLTTPIAYITSWPKDPFERFAGSSGWLPLKYIRPGQYYSEGVLVTNPQDYWYISVPATYPEDDGGSLLRYGGPSYPSNQITPNMYWFMFSVGPDGDLESGYGLPKRAWYDPTNGTVSNGNIIRTSDSQMN